MTLEAIYYIGQTIAVIAILGSLVAIFFQQKRANDFELANGQRDLLNRARELFSLAAKDEATLTSIQSGLHDYQSANDFQQATFSAWAFHAFMTIQQAYYLNAAGLVKNDVYQAYVNYAMATLNTKGGRDWWVTEGSKTTAVEFAAYIEDLFVTNGEAYPALYDVVPHYKLKPMPTVARAKSAPKK